MATEERLTLMLLWGRWGPYHHARYRALKTAAAARGHRVVGIEYSPASRDYAWMPGVDDAEIYSLKHPTCETRFSLKAIVCELLPLLERVRPDVILAPGYWHWSLATAVLGRLLNARIVMMNESHAATVKPGRCREWIRRMAMRLFDAAFVGGQPQQRYYVSLGIPADCITTGYDAVDNAFFARHAGEAEQTPDRPFFLWGGRMEPKKDVQTLITAWTQLRERLGPNTPDLRLVGDGSCRPALLAQCAALGLPIDAPDRPSVRFAPFAPPEVLARLYAHSLAYVLPSHLEEWGLVVNEALAAGAPVVVSSAAGCVEDLLLRYRVQDQPGTGVLCRNGIVFPSGDAQALANSLELLTCDPDLRAGMAAAAPECVEPCSLTNFAASALRATSIALHR